MYPYDVVGGQNQIFKTDFEAKVDIIHVGDPNIFSQTQRNSVEQAEMQMNARPLLAISDSPSDNNLLSIKPAYLVLGRSLIQIPSSLDKLKLDKLKTTTVTTMWDARKILKRKFFLRWQEDQTLR